MDRAARVAFIVRDAPDTVGLLLRATRGTPGPLAAFTWSDEARARTPHHGQRRLTVLWPGMLGADVARLAREPDVWTRL
jgi:hypothetical protein